MITPIVDFRFKKYPPRIFEVIVARQMALPM